MPNHSATAILVTDEHGQRAVVTEADPEIWVATELWDQAVATYVAAIRGAATVDGDLLSFGVEGEGLGRLTYQRIGTTDLFGQSYIVCVRVPAAEPTP